jgi:ferric-dicitrate binding protein FerR (iron transport regulator)
MKGDADFDELLQREFEQLKSQDRLHAPPFGAMLERARHDFELTPVAAIDAAPRAAATRTWTMRRRVMLWAGPLAIAAGLGAIWFIPERTADREFDRLVMEWSQTAAATSRAPTDGLLATPGGDFLGAMPSIGSGIGGRRGRS